MGTTFIHSPITYLPLTLTLTLTPTMQRATTSAFRPALRQAAVRRQFAHKPIRRGYATAGQAEAPGSSHLAAGVAGGAVVILAGYGYYYFSGAKTAVDSVRTVSQTAKDVKNKAVQSIPSPKAMIGFIRSAVHTYAAAIPGAGYLVDSTFDQLDTIAEKHGPEVEKIIKDVYNDISKAAQKGGDKTSDQIMAAVQEAVSKMQKLASQTADSTLKPLMDKNPQLKSAINDSLGELQHFGDRYGPEARKIADDTINQLKQLSDKGLNAESLTKASSLVQEKLQQIKDLGAKASSEAYQKAAESARPYLEKAPEVKKYLEGQLDGLKEYVGGDGIKLINSTYEELESAGKKGDTKQLMKIAQEKVAELQKLAKEQGGKLANKATEKAGSFPGADKLLASAGIPGLADLGQLRKLAAEKGGDFEKLLNETAEELKQLLEKKGKQAKELSSQTVDEAKKQSGK